MLIDDFLPQYDVREQHELLIEAPLQQVYRDVRRLDLSRAKFTMLLLKLRGMFARSHGVNLDDFLRLGFILLGEKRNEELLLGVVGRFWTTSGALLHLDAAAFERFNEPGYAKAVWNFTAVAQAEHTTLLKTETRVLCLDKVSLRRFRIYWLVVGPFSGLIRRDILASIKRNAENQR